MVPADLRSEKFDRHDPRELLVREWAGRSVDLAGAAAALGEIARSIGAPR